MSVFIDSSGNAGVKNQKYNASDRIVDARMIESHNVVGMDVIAMREMKAGHDMTIFSLSMREERCFLNH